MLRKSLCVALGTLPEQRQAIADGKTTQETYDLVAQRVAVLAAQAKAACEQLAAIGEQDWPALHAHVPACLTCKPRDARRLRERVEYLAPSLVALPEDDDRYLLAWQKITETANRINSAFADLQVAKLLIGFVGLLLTGELVLVSSEPLPASSVPDVAQSAPATGPTADVDPSALGRAPATSSSAPGPGAPESSKPETVQADEKPAVLQGRQGTRAVRRNVKPPATSNSPCVDDTRRTAPKRPDPAPGSINIDARPLTSRHFLLPDQTDWLDARSVHTLQLAPGTYGFQVGAPVAFRFTVLQDGTIDYPSNLKFVSGKGTRTLRIEGVVVTLDARRLAPGAGVLIAHVPVDDHDWIMCKKVRMVPAKHYQVQQGGGRLVSMSFEVTCDGRVLFDPGLAYLRGNGTSTLEFLGYLVHVDARRAGGQGLLVHHVQGIQMSGTKEQTLYLLPTTSHWLQVGNQLSDAGFTLQNNGSIVLKHDALTLDNEKGVTVVTVTRPLQ